MFIPDPDLDFLPITDPGSRGKKGTGSRIPDQDSQHCFGSLKRHQVDDADLGIRYSTGFTSCFGKISSEIRSIDIVSSY
jgi:hypothetical protein